jgi:ADYC domain
MILKRVIFAGIAVGLVSCVAGDAQPDEPATDAIAARDRQGTRLQGGILDTWYAYLPTATVLPTDPVTAAGARFDDVTVRYGSISANRSGAVIADADLVGAMFYGENQRTRTQIALRVDAVQPRPSSITGLPEFQYSIKVKDGTGVETPLCDGAAGNVAIPAPGSWDSLGAFNTASRQFTFLCLTGVAEKCVRWGYRYWEPQYAAYHQACTRMARADYCGDGESHTVDGTLVDLYDRRGLDGDPAFINQTPAATPALAFEAAWPAKGSALCLSKLRWATLPLGGYCPTLLPDPRVDVQNPRAKFCDDIPGTARDRINVLSDAGASVFNDSAYLDAGLYRWSNSIGRQYTTSRGFYDPSGRGNVAPAAGYSTASYVGALYRVGIDPTLLPAGAVRLRTWRQTATGKFITTTINPNTITGPTYTPHATEGWLLPPSVEPAIATARKLSLFQNTDGSFVTTTDSPGPSYRRVRLEGYLLR